MKKQKFSFPIAVGFLSVALLATSCSPTSSPTGNMGVINVGSKDFTEEFIVAEMYAFLLEDAGFEVNRKLNLGGTPIAHEAIVNGDIDIYPEYTSTGLLTVLKMDALDNPIDIINEVRAAYEEQFDLTWLEPSPFNNTQALATTEEISSRFDLQTFTDLSKAAENLVLGGPAEFIEREDGLPGLQNKYGGFEFKEVRQLGTGSLRYQALLDGEIDVVVAFGTDGQIDGNNLVLLEDDLGLYPIYNIAPVLRKATLEQYPEIEDVLNSLAPYLTNDVMSGLNWQVDGPEKREPADVAYEFLKENSLVK